MDQLMDKLSEVSKRIEQLGQRLTVAEEENEQLKVQLSESIHELKIKDQRISELSEKQKIITLAGSLPSGESRKDVKLKINDMVREIDKCIALLNS